MVYQNSLIDGTSLADRSICLTFDDGPGEQPVRGQGLVLWLSLSISINKGYPQPSSWLVSLPRPSHK